MNPVQYTTTYTVWHLPKLGDPESFYADRYAPIFPHKQRQYHGTIRFSVADGVSSAYFSGRWAGQLTSAYLRDGDGFLQSESLNELATSWNNEESRLLQARYPITSSNNRIIRERKLRKIGGASTLHGLELNQKDRTWTSLCIGDSCLFQIRNGTIIRLVPEINADMFGSTPAQISTLRTDETDLHTIRKTGNFKEGDSFLLATDSLSRWILRENSLSNDEKIQQLLSINTQDEFGEYINKERITQRMDDDDITLAIIRIGKTLPNLRSKCRTCKHFDCPHRPVTTGLQE